LLPDRYPTPDFFLCDLFDAAPKADMASMEHPIFSLATRPDLRVLRYAHNDVTIEVVPSVRGLATLFDKDILIYCISQLMAALNAGRPVSRLVHLTAHDLLVATNRETSGDAYRRLREAFERLAGTRITTNLMTGGQEVTSGFGLIEGWPLASEGTSETTRQPFRRRHHALPFLQGPSGRVAMRLLEELQASPLMCTIAMLLSTSLMAMMMSLMAMMASLMVT
jgi:hypothetical protein